MSETRSSDLILVQTSVCRLHCSYDVFCLATYASPPGSFVLFPIDIHHRFTTRYYILNILQIKLQLCAKHDVAHTQTRWTSSHTQHVTMRCGRWTGWRRRARTSTSQSRLRSGQARASGRRSDSCRSRGPSRARCWASRSDSLFIAYFPLKPPWMSCSKLEDVAECLISGTFLRVVGRAELAGREQHAPRRGARLIYSCIHRIHVS